MRSLRVICTEYCGRSCPGCCNKEFKTHQLPDLVDLWGYPSDPDRLILTGGEPMLFPQKLEKLIHAINTHSTVSQVIVYASTIQTSRSLEYVLGNVYGFTYTLHDQSDIDLFYLVDDIAQHFPKCSLRLNVFKGVTIPFRIKADWQYKYGIEWIENCPLPEDDLCKLSRLWVREEDFMEMIEIRNEIRQVKETISKFTVYEYCH